MFSPRLLLAALIGMASSSAVRTPISAPAVYSTGTKPRRTSMYTVKSRDGLPRGFSGAKMLRKMAKKSLTIRNITHAY